MIECCENCRHVDEQYGFFHCYDFCSKVRVLPIESNEESEENIIDDLTIKPEWCPGFEEGAIW